MNSFQRDFHFPETQIHFDIKNIIFFRKTQAQKWMVVTSFLPELYKKYLLSK